MMKVFRSITFLGGFFILWAAIASRAQDTNAIKSLDELRSRLGAYLEQPRFSQALWGIKIVSLSSGKTLFESHPDRLMSPASNSKLYTGALGLMRLGGDYRLATPVYAAGTISRSGTLWGNLVIVGGGDPSWNERRLGSNFWTAFDPFVTVLTNAGVRRISGDIVADATFFRGPPTGSGWMIDDLKSGDVGMLSALTLDDNVAQVRVEPGAVGAPCKLTFLQPGTGLILSNGTVTVAANAPAHVDFFNPPGASAVLILGQLPAGSPGETIDLFVPRPADWFAAALKIVLNQHGIKIFGHPRGVMWPESGSGIAATNAIKLGTILSPPLRDVIRGFMKPSQNLEADTLLADVGELTRGTNVPPWRGSEDAGLAALQQFLDDVGVTPGDVRFDEGSGLSRNNLTTANATVALLQYMEQSPEAQDFLDALPVGGVDGTLRRRFHNTAAAGNVAAKTGTLRWAHALSGYITTAAGERLAFSIMLNRFAAAPGRSGHDEIDPIVLMMAGYASRSDDVAALAKSYAPLGTLLITSFTNAPFPHPDRAAGHKYHEQFYSAAEHYSDSNVGLFIPKNFQVADKIDFVVHFHGWRHTVAGTLPEYKLVEQFAGSGKNAILIVPQGPYNVPDSFDGKLEDTNGFARFMDEAVAKLKGSGALAQTNFGIGNIILSGHSGGYHVMASILNHGGLSDKIVETWLFDALYAGTGDYAGWQKREDGRLLNIYTDHGGTRDETRSLMATYRTNGVSFFAAEDTNALPSNLLTNKIVFLHTDMVHNDVVSKRGTFEEFLKTSCLQNINESSQK
jgi:D-alanyl-D-alanine carboxypeptidase/D-alanyl-D-alanine-endopeptidase (penicillin-binding protein 4)